MEMKIEQEDMPDLTVGYMPKITQQLVLISNGSQGVIIERSNIPQLITILQDFLKKEDEKDN